MTTLLLLMLLGAEPEVEIIYPGSTTQTLEDRHTIVRTVTQPEPSTFTRTTGPLLTNERCDFMHDNDPRELLVSLDQMTEGRTVCIEEQIVDAECLVQVTSAGSDRPCVLSYKRFCWCAEQEQ